MPKHSCKKKNCTHFSFSWGCVQFSNGGELGIRTPGCFHINGFQDRRFRPLSQLSILNLMSDFLADLPSILYFWLKIKNLMKKVKKFLLFYNNYVNDNKSTHEQIFNRHIFSVYLQMKSKFWLKKLKFIKLCILFIKWCAFLFYSI